jgi:phage-related minor tail protein
MDDEIEQLLVSVRADTQGFARDVATMRGQIDGPLTEGLGRAGKVLERGLLAALRRGSLGFDDLKRVALAAMEDIAAAALSRGLASIGLGGGGGTSLAGGLLSGLLGLPGRATGGPVSAGRPYLVGERGPELFVPSGFGRVEPRGSAPGGRDVRVSISINGGGQSAPAALHASSRQVARAVRRALIEE